MGLYGILILFFLYIRQLHFQFVLYLLQVLRNVSFTKACKSDGERW